MADGLPIARISKRGYFMNQVRFGTLAAVLCCVSISGAHAQGPAPVVSAPPPGLSKDTGAPFPKGQYGRLDQLPDWGGAWFRTFGPPDPSAPSTEPKPKGKYLEAYRAWRAEAEANDGVVKSTRSNCAPPGMPIFMQLPQYPYEFLFTPGRVTINQEAWMMTRRIWTDGREHPEDPDPSYYGHSIGHWEGDTLVVDTVGIKDDIDMAYGLPHSDKMRITERIHIKSGSTDMLINEMTIDDPEALEEPFKVTVSYMRDRYGQLLEFQCTENDRNPVDAEGNTQFK